LFESNVWVPDVANTFDVVLLQEYNLNIPIDPSSNYGEFVGDTGNNSVTGSGWQVQLWGSYVPV
jgi:hypothetical protein